MSLLDALPPLDATTAHTLAQYVRAYADWRFSRGTMTWAAISGLADHLETLYTEQIGRARHPRDSSPNA